MGRLLRRRASPRVLAAALISLGVVIAIVVTIASSDGVGGPRDVVAPDARAAAPDPKRLVSLAWVGDITPGSIYGVLPGEGRSLYVNVRDRLREHDLALGNLEGTLGNGGVAKCPLGTPHCFSFRAPPRAARGLRWAGFDALNLANNHSYDYGLDAQISTLEALDGAGIRPVGLPERVQVLRRAGVGVAIVGFSTYPWTTSMDDPGAVRRLVGRAGRLGDVVVAVMHAGAEGEAQSVTPSGPERYLGEPRGHVRRFARQAIDAGADLVLGSGPHVLRGIELYRGRLIAYSLGNFAGVKNFSVRGDLRLSALLAVRVTSDGAFRSGHLHSLVLDASGRPSRDPRAAASRFVRRASMRDFPRTAVDVRPSGRLLAPRALR